MPCKVYEQLKQETKSAQSEWAYFAYDENKALRGVSDRKSKQLAKEARVKWNEASRRAEWHRQSCEECKAGG